MAKGIREREYQNLMIQWSIPPSAGPTPPAGHCHARPPRPSSPGTCGTRSSGSTPAVIDGFDVDTVVEEITATVNAVEGGLVRANEQVLHLLRGRKEFRDSGGVWHALRLVDFDTPAANTLVVSDEVAITVPGKTSRRFDLVYWVNGLPLVVVEVKSPRPRNPGGPMPPGRSTTSTPPNTRGSSPPTSSPSPPTG